MSLTSSVFDRRHHLRTKLQNKPPLVPKDTLDFPLTESIYIPSQDWSPSSSISLESPISMRSIGSLTMIWKRYKIWDSEMVLLLLFYFFSF
ncbi:hypothetical protein RchiOBHm_Chr1g0352931 [Rosa chinensis]|uniref:Uncharacterized protein n=1 Tax=Rosa chinensis TaxID=74649 RepID=A0A2P6SGP7_ROSCH|nr:hypothetical protein RchiOBHm_Chr1g0352931 [Rosa chinensis]